MDAPLAALLRVPALPLRRARAWSAALLTGAGVSVLVAVLAVALLVAGGRVGWVRPDARSAGLWVPIGLVGLYGTTSLVVTLALLVAPDRAGFTAGHALVTVSWTVVALALLARGISRPALRVTGLVLVAAAVAKLVLFDLVALDGIARVAAFLGAGLVLLAAGTRYARLVAEAAARRSPRIPATDRDAPARRPLALISIAFAIAHVAAGSPSAGALGPASCRPCPIGTPTPCGPAGPSCARCVTRLTGGHRDELRSALALSRMTAAAEISRGAGRAGRPTSPHHLERADRAGRQRVRGPARPRPSTTPPAGCTPVGRRAAPGAAADRRARGRCRCRPGWPGLPARPHPAAAGPSRPAARPAAVGARRRGARGRARGGCCWSRLLVLPLWGLPAGRWSPRWPRWPPAPGSRRSRSRPGPGCVAAERPRLRRHADDVLAAARRAPGGRLGRRLIELEAAAAGALDAAVAAPPGRGRRRAGAARRGRAGEGAGWLSRAAPGRSPIRTPGPAPASPRRRHRRATARPDTIVSGDGVDLILRTDLDGDGYADRVLRIGPDGVTREVGLPARRALDDLPSTSRIWRLTGPLDCGLDCLRVERARRAASRSASTPSSGPCRSPRWPTPR